MKEYINKTLRPITFIIVCLTLCACSYELYEGLTGKFYRYSVEAAEMFGLLKEGSPTNLYYWEFDYFRITVHVSFLLLLAVIIIYFSTILKFKRFDRVKVIVILLSIVIALNIPYMLYNFVFTIYAPYLLSLLSWIISIGTIICSIVGIIMLKRQAKYYRNYSIEVKAIFVGLEFIDILGYFSFNDYQGVIKYSKNPQDKFEEINGEYIIYVDSHDIKEFENDFVYKLGYWSYYIEKVVSRFKNKELDYSDNANEFAMKFLEEFENTRKGKK